MTERRKRLTQREEARWLGVSLRSYVSYENDADDAEKANTPKFRFLASELERLDQLDEDTAC